MKFADLPAYFEHIRENLGYSRYKAAQMASMNNESLKDLETGETYQRLMDYLDHLMKAYNIHDITINRDPENPASLSINFDDFSPAGRHYFRILMEREEQMKAAAKLNQSKQKGQ